MTAWKHHCKFWGRGCRYGSDTRLDIMMHQIGCPYRPPRNPTPR